MVCFLWRLSPVGNIIRDMTGETIFYSWQSDNRSTRNYIEKALRAAIEGVAESPDIESSPRLDKDTEGVPGAVHIVNTIREKIDKSSIFLADISLIDTGKFGRRLVNQNVMFELGYAIGRHTETRVILVANTDLGDIRDLPFDISHLRIIQFSLKKDPNGAELKRKLKSAIAENLRALSVEQNTKGVVSVKEGLTDAIVNKKPTRTIAKKYFDSIYQQYLDLSPGRYQNGSDIDNYVTNVYEAYANTKHIAIELHEVFELAAEYKKEDVLMQAYKSVRLVSKYFGIVPEDNGVMSEVSKEYYVLVVREIVSLLLGSLSHDKLWELMQEIAKIKPARSGVDGEMTLLVELGRSYPGHVADYFKKLRDSNYTVPLGVMIQERFSDNEGLLQTYLDGNMLHYFITEEAYPWLIVLLLGESWVQYVPEFFSEFKDTSFISALCDATGKGDFLKFRATIWGNISKDRDVLMYHHSNLLHVFKHIGIASDDNIAGPSWVAYGGMR